MHPEIITYASLNHYICILISLHMHPLTIITRECQQELAETSITKEAVETLEKQGYVVIDSALSNEQVCRTYE